MTCCESQSLLHRQILAPHHLADGGCLLASAYEGACACGLSVDGEFNLDEAKALYRTPWIRAQVQEIAGHSTPWIEEVLSGAIDPNE